MGNQNCSEIYNYTEQNQAYGDYKILKGSKTMALIEKSLEKDYQLQEEVRQKLQLRMKLKSNHLIKLQKYEIDSNKYSTHVRMYYEFINRTLEDKYKQKLSQQVDFTQRQLFNIIYGVENALDQLNKYEIRHGCINLTTVLCQSNFYKVTDVSSTTFVKSYHLVWRGCRNQFLSQKLLTNLEYRSLQPQYEIEDDLFSLGMIILTLTSKAHPQHFYQWKQKQCTAQLKWDNIENSIKKLERTYSSKLSKKVKQLIGFSQELDKSLQTNSTTAYNNHTLTYNRTASNHNPNQLGQITDSIHELDKDIDRILSRVNINTSIPKILSKQSLNNQRRIIKPSNSQHPSFEQSSRISNPQYHNLTLFEKSNDQQQIWKSVKQDKRENSF